MTTERIDLSAYKEDNSFYKPFKLLITIQSFDLKAIRERYLKNKNKKSNRTGSVNRRETAMGGIAEVTIKNGYIENLEILAKMPEPRGVDSTEEVTAFSSEDKVHVVNEKTLKTITNPWFSYIHTVDIDKNSKNRLLVSSSGFDCIFEYRIDEQQQLFEWFAWENGFEQGLDPETGAELFLTRNKETAAQYKASGKKCLFISDPANQVLPTAKRAAFINSVVYDPINENNIIATFFHEGAVYQMNKQTGEATRVLKGLNNPHGGMKNGKNDFMATSTRSGEIVTGNLDSEKRFWFENLEGKPEMLGDMEWVQNTKLMDGHFIAIDSNRNVFFIIDPANELISPVAYDPNWAVQDLVISCLSEDQKYMIRNFQA